MSNLCETINHRGEEMLPTQKHSKIVDIRAPPESR